MAHIINKVLEIQPDVVCFQEVVPGFAKQLISCVELPKLYSISGYDPVFGYGNISLAKHEHLPSFHVTHFLSKMGRKLTSTMIQIDGAAHTWRFA
jgi:hypothetical protein